MTYYSGRVLAATDQSCFFGGHRHADLYSVLWKWTPPQLHFKLFQRCQSKWHAPECSLTIQDVTHSLHIQKENYLFFTSSCIYLSLFGSSTSFLGYIMVRCIHSDWTENVHVLFLFLPNLCCFCLPSLLANPVWLHNLCLSLILKTVNL